MYSAILLSGGKGVRMDKKIPKQYLLLSGKPIIMHSLEKIDQIEEINEIVIVCEDSFISNINLMVQQYNIETKIKYVHSGKNRQESVYNGLNAAENEKVLIHEAARPFVKRDLFIDLINDPCENATLGYPIPFTVLKGDGYVTDCLDRKELINVQLPQKFNKDLLLKAHDEAKKENKVFTEDASLLFNYFKTDIKVINGSSFNIKITEPIDLLTGEIIYKEYIVGRK